MTDKEALVVLSGGQDSTTCLFWAKKNFENVRTVTFDYGQRHKIEIESAVKIAELAEVSNQIIKLSGFAAIGGNALTDDISVESDLQANGLPNTFVPGRNLIFLTYAAAYAYNFGIQDIVTGVCQTDYSGYPDCRRDTIDALVTAINAGMEASYRIQTPLMYLTKAEIVELAQEVGALEALSWSHTCYNGSFPPCGECPACSLRAKGFEEASIEDPLLARAA